jgi:cell division transport system permease protein
MANLFLIRKGEGIVGSNWKTLREDVKKETLLSVTNLLVMTITFLVLGFLIYIVAFSQTVLRDLEQEVKVTVYFKDEFTEDKIKTFVDEYTKNPRVKDIKYVSKQDAYELFKEINKNDTVILEALSPEILPASVYIRTKNIFEVPKLADEVSKVDGVEGVKFFKEAVERFTRLSTVIYIVGFVLAASFLLISYSVIIATLRTAINSKGSEFAVMKLVGASDKYVMSPLLRMGLFFGIVSSLIASVVLALISFVMYKGGLFHNGVQFGFIQEVRFPLVIFTLIVSALLLISGVVLGYFGSSAAIKKYLKY